MQKEKARQYIMLPKPNLIYKTVFGYIPPHLNSWLANSLNPSKFIALLKNDCQTTVKLIFRFSIL